MPHECNLGVKKNITHLESGSMSRLKAKYLQWIIVSEKNPLCSLHFRSEKSIREEKIRQLNSKHRYVIHPLSRFRQAYDIYSFVLYSLLLFVKPIDASINKRQQERDMSTWYPKLSLFLDVFTWADIIIQLFFIGYIDQRNKVIVIEHCKVIKHYAFGVYFICDLLSSIPRYLFDYFIEFIGFKIVLGIRNIFYTLKIVRLCTIVRLVTKISQYFSVRSKTTVFLLSFILLFVMVLHFCTCQLISIPRVVRYYFASKEEAEIWVKKFRETYYHRRYIECCFKSSAYLLGIRLNFIETINEEDYIVAITTYCVGKILIASTWIVLAMAIFNRRSMSIKFQELMNQLNEYMRQKQLPMVLRRRITEFYEFKYQRTFFKEELVKSMLSERLQNDINMHLCRSLIANVSLFADLTQNQVSEVVGLLIPEIFLPNDTIIQSGSHGDAMYFLSSGTVAVYTHSGKEVCHLQDGAYFGEVSFVLRGQSRTATVIAIEISQVYRLNKRDFKRSIMKNEYVFKTIVSNAENRLKQTMQIEEQYKRALFEKKFIKSNSPIEKSPSNIRTGGRSTYRSSSKQMNSIV